jgi:Flp pilus assembly protein protease CpaA
MQVVFAIPWWSAFVLALTLGAVVLVIERRTGEIPNAFSLGLLVVAGVLAIVDRKIGSHFGGFAIAALVTLILYRYDAIGGGTVKWTCALAMVLGARDGAIMMFAGGLAAAIWLAVARFRAEKGSGWVASSPFIVIGIVVALANVVAERRGLW